MLARRVWSGTRPSWYISVRASSAPPRRPAQRILMPSAPKSMAVWTAFFMARRKEMRRSSWRAMFSATNWASSSGVLISWMSTKISLPVMRLSSSLILSISAPLRPMTTPGRAVKMVMRQRVAARSIWILGTDADSSFFLRMSRIRRSSASSLPNSFFSAYHFERQSLVTAMRSPMGLVFWPISIVRQHDLDVAAPFQDGSRRTARLGGETSQGGGGLRRGFLDAQDLGFEAVVVFGVGDGGFEGLGDEAGGFAGHDGEHGLRREGVHTLNLAHDFAHLLRRHAHVAGDRLYFHRFTSPPPWPCGPRVCGRRGWVKTRRAGGPPCSPSRTRG